MDRIMKELTEGNILKKYDNEVEKTSKKVNDINPEKKKLFPIF